MDDNASCNVVRAWIQQAAQSGQPDSPSAELCSHVAECAQCRGALLVLLAQLSPVPLHVTETTCQECQHDLAAYIDREREVGTPAAVREYPYVWWHTIVCHECFTTYQMTGALLDAEQRGALARLADVVQAVRSAAAVPARSPRLLKRLHIPRQFLSRTLGIQPLLGIMRGAERDDTVLFDEAASGYTITLSVQKQVDATWNVIVIVTPPMRGQAVLTFGTTVFRAAFNQDGQATIAGIPADLLTASDGPDMDLAIEPEPVEPDALETA